MQIVDAIVKPVMTYACEEWALNKEEKKLKSILSETLKQSCTFRTAQQPKS